MWSSFRTRSVVKGKTLPLINTEPIHLPQQSIQVLGLLLGLLRFGSYFASHLSRVPHPTLLFKPLDVTKTEMAAYGLGISKVMPVFLYPSASW